MMTMRHAGQHPPNGAYHTAVVLALRADRQPIDYEVEALLRHCVLALVALMFNVLHHTRHSAGFAHPADNSVGVL